MKRIASMALAMVFTCALLDARLKVVTLNLDHRVTGVGGTANSVLNPYRVAPGEIEFTFRIKPIVE